MVPDVSQARLMMLFTEGLMEPLRVGSRILSLPTYRRPYGGLGT
jgi:hypothetical protein